MRILIACEFSGIVREAFAKRGHDAWSCDLLDTEIPGQHIKDDVLKHLDDGWDMMIAHPPCTYVAVCGASWFSKPGRAELQQDAIQFAEALWSCDIPRIAIENPVGVLSTRSKLGKPTQIIQPWQFGESFSKKTCLWLKNLPKLQPTQIVDPGEFVTFASGRRMPKWYSDKRSLPKEQRQLERSRTFLGIADAMAAQWSGELFGLKPSSEMVQFPILSESKIL